MSTSPRLVHLNGPPGVGKSTLARRWVADHHGALALDLDVLAGLVGGWDEDFPRALEVAREHGRQMAARHLRLGHDVVLPQLVTVYDQVPDPAFEETAAAAGATYVQVALTVEDGHHLVRLRGREPTDGVQRRVRALLLDPTSDMVSRIRSHLEEYLSAHPPQVWLDTTQQDEQTTYQRLRHALTEL